MGNAEWRERGREERTTRREGTRRVRGSVGGSDNLVKSLLFGSMLDNRGHPSGSAEILTPHDPR